MNHTANTIPGLPPGRAGCPAEKAGALGAGTQSRAPGRPQDKLWASPQTSPVSLPCHVSLDHSSGLFRAHGALSDHNDSALASVTIWSQTSHQPVSLAGSPALPRSGCSERPALYHLCGSASFPECPRAVPIGELCRWTGCEHRQPPRATGAGMGGGAFASFTSPASHCLRWCRKYLPTPPLLEGSLGQTDQGADKCHPSRGSLRGGQQVDGNAGLLTEQVLFG